MACSGQPPMYLHTQCRSAITCGTVALMRVCFLGYTCPSTVPLHTNSQRSLHINKKLNKIDLLPSATLEHNVYPALLPAAAVAGHLQLGGDLVKQRLLAVPALNPQLPPQPQMIGPEHELAKGRHGAICSLLQEPSCMWGQPITRRKCNQEPCCSYVA